MLRRRMRAGEVYGTSVVGIYISGGAPEEGSLRWPVGVKTWLEEVNQLDWSESQLRGLKVGWAGITDEERGEEEASVTTGGP